MKIAIFKVLCQIQPSSVQFSQELLKLINTTPEDIIPLLLKNARILPETLENRDQILTQMCHYSFIYSNLEQEVPNVLWTLCHRGSVIKTSPYILERLLDVLPNDVLNNNLDLLLVTGVKVFLQSPAETQHILGRIFHYANQQVGTAADVSDKLHFYSNLLQNHSALCRKTLLQI